eukprot:15475524-Alexandrium_andersonii.AAC.1
MAPPARHTGGAILGAWGMAALRCVRPGSFPNSLGVLQEIVPNTSGHAGNCCKLPQAVSGPVTHLCLDTGSCLILIWDHRMWDHCRPCLWKLDLQFSLSST